MRSSRFWSAVAFTVALSVHANAQQVDDATRSAARQLATDGSAAYQANDFAQAYDQFNRAYQLVHVPTVGIWAARSLLKLGRLVEASERYLEVARSPLPADAPAEHLKAQKDANDERAALLPRIPSVRVILEGADPSEVFVTLNDQLLQAALLGVKRPVDPGKFRVKGVRGEQVVDAEVELAEGTSKDVTLTFSKLSHVKASAAPPPPSQPVPATAPPALEGSPDHTLAYVAFSVGGAALVTGGIFGALALSKKSDLDAACPDRRCLPAQHSDNDSYETKKLVSGVGLIAG
ncbi:MAG: hypothetical protein ABW061_23165, partial [Polyangiaceae bacterium]